MSTTYRKILFPFFAASLLFVTAGALTGCEEEGPAEEVGEKIDEGLNDASRAIKDAAD
jgi:hypothetical protein